MINMQKISVEKLSEAVKNFKNLTIGVVGDIMLDRFIFGETERISPEAPVPIVRQKKEIYTPGGAGNVANNLKALGSQVYLIGLMGDDRAGKKLSDIFKKKKINIQGSIFSNSRPTTEKIRVIARNQQIIRIDREEGSEADKKVEKKIVNFLDRNISRFDCLVISDYVKGLVAVGLAKKIIKLANKHKIPIVVDTKNKNISHFKNIKIITPNKTEAQAITGEKDTVKAGKKIVKIVASSVLITEGSQGMRLFENGHIRKLPALAREVYDVTGAGDTVASVLALAIASGLSLSESVHLSNLAAGIVVGKIGTATLETIEILENLPGQAEKISRKNG
jgi:rfaE bifunctional protein kinase chain/domain